MTWEGGRAGISKNVTHTRGHNWPGEGGRAGISKNVTHTRGHNWPFRCLDKCRIRIVYLVLFSNEPIWRKIFFFTCVHWTLFSICKLSPEKTFTRSTLKMRPGLLFPNSYWWLRGQGVCHSIKEAEQRKVDDMTYQVLICSRCIGMISGDAVHHVTRKRGVKWPLSDGRTINYAEAKNGRGSDNHLSSPTDSTPP